MNLTEALTEALLPAELEATETFILQAWLQETDEYLAWCEENDEHDHVDTVDANRNAIADEIEAR